VKHLASATSCHSEWSWTCSQPIEMKVPVILSEAKDLQLLSELTFTNKCRSFASLRACDFFGFLAIFAHLTLLLSAPVFGQIEKNHKLSG